MKKLIGLLAVLFLMGCDDGDMSFETFDFSDSEPQVCGESDVLFKINGTEVLILNIDFENFSNVAKNDTITLEANDLIYRNYNGNVSSSVICSVIPPANPQVIEEWGSSQGAKINIFSSPITDDEGITTGYSHVIKIISVEFNKGDETIVITDNNFGSYTTDLSYNFDFTEGTVNRCTNGLLYKRNLNESIVLALTPEAYASLFPNENSDAPRTITVDPNDNRLIFDIYTGNITADVICADVPPVTPTIAERWNAEGTISVTTEFDTVNNDYRHNIKLIGVVFVNSLNPQETFEFDEYDLGDYTVSID